MKIKKVNEMVETNIEETINERLYDDKMLNLALKGSINVTLPNGSEIKVDVHQLLNYYLLRSNTMDNE